jgi:hypothetical protein
MLLNIAIALLILSALSMLTIRLWKPNFKFYWLIGAITVIIVWTIIVLLQLKIPFENTLYEWQPEKIYPVSPKLLLDDISWSYSIALVTLLLSVILTAATSTSREGDKENIRSAIDWQLWASSLTIVALGLLGTVSGNLLTLVIAWTALDIFELVFRLGNKSTKTNTNQIVIAFGFRITGTLLVTWVIALANSLNLSIELEMISPQISYFLLIAAGLRLGVIPIQSQMVKGRDFGRGFSTLLHLVPTSASLMILTRTNLSGMSNQIVLIFMILAGIAALYGSLSWFTSSDEIEAQPFWIITLASFTLASAVQSLTTASISWGIALLLSGGVISLFSTRNRRLLIFPFLGLLGITSLPFTTGWFGVSLYSEFMPNILRGIFILSQSLVISGYILFALRPGTSTPSIEKFVGIVYPWGLFLLPFVQYLVTYFIWAGTTNINRTLPSFLSSWPGFIACILASAITYWRYRGHNFPGKFTYYLRNFLSFNWLYYFISQIYLAINKVTSIVDRLVEGKGGILWTLLLLVLLISTLTRIEFGD